MTRLQWAFVLFFAVSITASAQYDRGQPRWGAASSVPDPHVTTLPPTNPPASVYEAAARDSARKDLEKAEKLLADPNADPNKVGKALELLKKAIREYPQYTKAHLLMGATYSSQKNWDQAQKSFALAAEFGPENASAYIGLGSVENEKKSFLEAGNHLLIAVKLAPDSPEAQFQLGRAYAGQGRWDLADEHVAKANQLRPGDPQQHVSMGNILLRERNAEGALKEFKEALRLDPTGPTAEPTQQMIARIEAALRQQAEIPK